MYRDLLSRIQYFDLICVVGELARIETTTSLVATRDNDTGSERTLMRQKQDRDNSMQRIRLLQVTITVDTLSHHQGRSLPSQPLSEIFLYFCIVDLVFCLLTVYTCDCWAPLSTDLQLDLKPLKTVKVYS